MGPLTGLKVIEVGSIGPGPFTAMMLSDMGADVTRVDRAAEVGTVDTSVPSPELMNRGRRSVAIDLKSAEGVDLLLEMVGSSDVMLEGFRPGVMERLGVGPEHCHAVNPRLVFGRATGWGQDGPYSMMAGHDLNYIALSGALDQFRGAGGPPVPPLNLLGDFGGGAMMLAFGVVCGVHEAQRSGQGQVVDAAILDGVALLNTCTYMMHSTGRWNGRDANLLSGAAPYYSVYECSDGQFVSVACLEPKFYAEFLRLMQIDPATVPAQADESQWPQTRARFAALFRERTQSQWCELLEGTDACFAPVLGPWSAPEHPHVAHRGLFAEIEGHVHPAPAPRFSRTPGVISRPPAHPGQHTDEVLADFGVDPDRIAQLRAAGTVA